MQRAFEADRAASIRPNPARSLFWGLFCFSVLMLVIAYVLVVPVLIVVTFLAFSRTPPSTAMGLAVGLVVGAVPVALGWYLMLLAGWSLSAVSRRTERAAVILAVIWAGAFAALLIA